MQVLTWIGVAMVIGGCKLCCDLEIAWLCTHCERCVPANDATFSCLDVVPCTSPYMSMHLFSVPRKPGRLAAASKAALRIASNDATLAAATAVIAAVTYGSSLAALVNYGAQKSEVGEWGLGANGGGLHLRGECEEGRLKTQSPIALATGSAAGANSMGAMAFSYPAAAVEVKLKPTTDGEMMPRY